MRVELMAGAGGQWHWVDLDAKDPEDLGRDVHPTVCRRTTTFALYGLEYRQPHSPGVGSPPQLYPCEVCERWGLARGLPHSVQMVERVRQGAESLASQIRQNKLALTYEVRS